MKKVLICLVAVCLAIQGRVKADFQILDASNENGESLLTLQFDMPARLQGVGHYAALGYALYCPKSDDNVYSKITLISDTTQLESDWRKGNNVDKYPALSLETMGSSPIRKVLMSLKGPQDTDWEKAILTLYLDSDAIAGWELDQAFFKKERYRKINEEKAAKLSSKTIGLHSSDDGAPYIVSIAVDDVVVQTNDFIKSTPTFVIQAKDDHEGISGWSFELIRANAVEKTVVATFNETFGSPQMGTQNLTMAITEPLLPDVYRAQIVIKDSENNTVTENSVTVKVESGLKLTTPIVGPNPYNALHGDLSVQYQLTEDADVAVWVYSISGELQWHHEVSEGESGGQTGLNTIEWNGKNNHGEWCANGPYVVYLQAQNANGKVKRHVKLMVLK